MIRILSGAGAGNQEGDSPSWTFPRGTGDEGPRSAACFYWRCLLSGSPLSGFAGGSLRCCVAKGSLVERELAPEGRLRDRRLRLSLNALSPWQHPCLTAGSLRGRCRRRGLKTLLLNASPCRLSGGVCPAAGGWPLIFSLPTAEGPANSAGPSAVLHPPAGCLCGGRSELRKS